MKAEARFIVDGIHIRDSEGRVVILRGCNLGGDSKVPRKPEGNPLSYDVSFVGRPFPEDEADGHFARLADWGFTFLRLVVTWEAVEHAGPGIYDEEYLAYLHAILKKAEAHGISVFVDPHQDVWSRWTGGDGAPGWTLEAVGFDLLKIDASGSAITMQGKGDSYKPMSWGLNYIRYAAATMNTLFFGGNTFAPGMMVEAVPVQDWLQDHFIAAMSHTARRLKDCASVVGFGIFNEPHYGYIGLPDLRGHGRITAPSGSAPSAFQTMAAASGYPQKARRFTLVGMIPLPGSDPLNPAGVSLFRQGCSCPWKAAGVWSDEGGTPSLRKPGYFSKFPAGHPREGQRLSYSNDFLKPFQRKFMEELSRKHAHYIFFAEGVPMGERVDWSAEDRARPAGGTFNVVDGLHWYEGLTLLTKKWRPWLIGDSETNAPIFGRRAARESIKEQLSRLASRPRAEGIPAFLGEFGIPFDLEGGRFLKSGDYSVQKSALGAFYDGIDAALAHSTIWNYSAGNTHRDGDWWCTEDLSIYCAEDGGGRAVRGFCRPYAMATAGMPAAMSFDTDSAVFSYVWDAAPGTTEVYVPSVWYPNGWKAEVAGDDSGNSDGRAACCEVRAELEERPDSQRLFVKTATSVRLSLTVRPLK